jgi:putative membrane protein
MQSQRTKPLLFAYTILLCLLAISGIQPFDRLTWLLEIFPILIALPIMWASYRRFPLTNLLYVSIFMHAIVLMIGGAYTYARVPFGFDIAELLHLSRNPYDKIGHFFQGAVPALVAREIFIRGGYVQGKKMLVFIVISVVMAISATYELIEWGAALIMGQGADEFLGTQGDQWDTQGDMFFAMIGAAIALALFSRQQDKQIAQLKGDLQSRGEMASN